MRRCPLCEAGWEECSGSSTCLFCGDREDGGFRCPGGHYVCEACRTDDPRDFTMRVCERSPERNPLVLWDLITAHPAFAGHGPQYHFVVFPILAGVLRNRGLLIFEPDAIARATNGLSEIPALSCSERGMCGAAGAAGAIVSHLLRATPASDRERRLALAASAKALLGIAAHEGGRCCRQSALTTLGSAWEFLHAELNLPLEAITIVCRRHATMPGCKRDCRYHE